MDIEVDSNISLIAQLLPEEVVRRLNMLPVKMEADQLYVATTAPVNLPGIDEIKLLTGLKVKPVIVGEDELTRLINEQFSAEQTSKQAIIDMTLQELATSDITVEEELPEVEDAPVVALVNSIIRGAVNDGASDIHLEPQYPEMRVRYRIGGILHDITTIPKYIEPSVISRIKLLADMDITERRRSQDGHITMDVDGKQIDLRISSVLTINGEKIVIRVLDKETMLIDLDHLGLSSDQQELFRSFISHPYGMILVTGPTGSGKSTTLYAVLKQLPYQERNIVTVENPVEYQMTGINQIQVNPYIGLTFATALRTIVRQDPDVIMVGEIRDFETADIAIQAALTGHLVFSTLHTNDAPGAVTRLLDMGVQPFLIASAVIGVVAQRLVRKICPECKEFYYPSDAELQLLGLPNGNITLARGRGCGLCHNTGYRGRTGIFEIFAMDDDIRRLVLAQAPSSEIRKVALAKGMRPLSEMGREKILQGISTLEEVQRVVYLQEEYSDRPLQFALQFSSGGSPSVPQSPPSSRERGDQPPLSADLRVLKEVFLNHFSDADHFFDGLIKAKNHRARYHILRILSLLEEYPRYIVSAAIKRAEFYGAFEYGAIRNICRQGRVLGRVPEPGSGQAEQLKETLSAEPVEERPLSYYSEFEK